MPAWQPDKTRFRFGSGRGRKLRLLASSLMLCFSITGTILAHDDAAEPAKEPAKQSSQLPQVKPSVTVAVLLKDPLLPEESRRKLLLQTGRFDELKNPTEFERAQIALVQGNWDDPVFSLSTVTVALKAHAALNRGEPQAVIDMIPLPETMEDGWLRASALTQTGSRDDARATIALALAANAKQASAEAHYWRARLLILQSELSATASKNFQAAADSLARARDAKLGSFWEARIVEARLLISKDNIEAGVAALVEALAIHPTLPEGWAMLADIYARTFQFDLAQQALDKLALTHPDHPDLLLIRARAGLLSRDLPAAEPSLEALLKRYPTHRSGMAHKAGWLALGYKTKPLESQLESYARVYPGDPYGPWVVGSMLSRARQYPDAKARFKQAIQLAPEWSNPWTDLGLLLMQSGEEEEARETLKHAVSLDAFRRDAVNQLRLVEDLLGYKTIRTEHFLIRYKQGIDEALARDMPPVLEQIYKDVTNTFGFKPKNPTLIELFPDSRSFAVRITGMPFIWTIGASTGDVIALASPRSGALQSGIYDWPRVVRHEFAHTVTLGMTQNRITHWFTEACAVNQEPGDRSFDTCLLLAISLQKNELFDLHEINWAFVRPKRPNDRALAYAQAAWMMEYIVETYGFQAVIRLLEGYRDGKSDIENFQSVTSISAEQFLTEFRSWAKNQVTQWGLSALTTEPKIVEALKSPSTSLAMIDGLLEEFPEDRRLLRRRADVLIASGDADQARQALYAYSRAVPVDSWPYQELLKLGPNPRNPREQTGALEFLDAKEVASGRWSLELAKAYRGSGMLQQSILAARRAVEREPYNPSYRELLATLLVQDKKLDQAAHEIEALMILEPAARKHKQRLIVIYKRLGREADALKLQQPSPEPDPPVGQQTPE